LTPIIEAIRKNGTQQAKEIGSRTIKNNSPSVSDLKWNRILSCKRNDFWAIITQQKKKTERSSIVIFERHAIITVFLLSQLHSIYEKLVLIDYPFN
jgi:predicted ATPase